MQHKAAKFTLGILGSSICVFSIYRYKITEFDLVNSATTQPAPESIDGDDFSRQKNEVFISKNFLSSILSDREAFINASRSSVVTLPSGKFGYLLDRIRVPSFFWKVGLWSGDTIVSINGDAVSPGATATSNDGSEAIFDRITRDHFLDLVLLREGKEHEIKVSGK